MLPKKNPTAHPKGLSNDTAKAWATTLPESSTQEPTGRTQKVRPAMERQTRADMHDEPSHEAVDKEIAYRWGQEASAMRRPSDNELEVVFKNGWKPSEYVASRDG